MRVLFILFFGLMINLSAHAETAVVIVGISKTASDFPTIEGATAECHSLKTHFTTEAGVSEDKVLAVCGDDATKERFYDKFDRFLVDNVDTKDILMLVWITHGQTDDDGSKFVVFANADMNRPQHEWAMSLDLLMAMARQKIPLGVPILALFETQRPRTVGGKTLIGPVVADFEKYLGVMAIGNSEPPINPAMSEAVQLCLRLETDLEMQTRTITVGDLRECMGKPLAQRGLTRPVDVGLITNFTLLRGEIISDLGAKPKPVDKPKAKMKPASLVLYGTGGVAAVLSGITYSLAKGMAEDATSQEPWAVYASEEEYQRAHNRYGTLRTATLATRWLSVGLVVSGTGALVLTTSHHGFGIKVQALW